MPSIQEHLKAKLAEMEALAKHREDHPEEHLKVAELLPAPASEDVVVAQPEAKDAE